MGIIAIILTTFSLVFISLSITAIAVAHKEIFERVGGLCRPWIMIVGAISTFILVYGGCMYIIDNTRTSKEKPQYQIVTEPVYKKI